MALEWLGPVVTGTTGLINGIFNSGATGRANKRNIQFARESQQEQERFAKEMFNMENAYNDPSAVMDRLGKAGINPNAYWSQSSGTAGLASGDSSVSPVTPNIQPIPSPLEGLVGSQPFQALKELHEIEGVKKENERRGIENSRLADVIEADLNNKASQTMLNETRAKYQNMVNDGFPEYRAKELLALEFQAYQAAANGDLAKQQRITETYNSKAAKWKVEKYNPLLESELNENINLIKERQTTEQTTREGILAGAANSYASAALNRAKTLTENELREHVVESQKIMNRLNKAVAKQEETKAKYIDDQIVTDLELAIKQSSILDGQKDLLLQRVRYAKKENDWYEIHQIQSIMNDVVDGVAKLLPTSSVRSGSKTMDGHTVTYHERTSSSRLP